jgi:hypothetical protein
VELVAVAREAFTSSLRLTAIVSAVIVLVLAIATARYLRPVAASTAREMHPPGDIEPSTE